MIDRLTAIRDMARRSEHRARVPDNAMFAAMAQELDAIIGSIAGGITLGTGETQLVREALSKRIDRSLQKIKHYEANPLKIARQPNVIQDEVRRLADIRALIARIDGK